MLSKLAMTLCVGLLAVGCASGTADPAAEALRRRTTTTAESTSTTVEATTTEAPATTEAATTTEAPTTTELATSTTEAVTTTVAPTTTTTPAPTWPDASNTGVRPGTVLKPSGSITISTPGAVVTDLDVQGSVLITAPNVTFKNSRVRSTAAWVINVRDASLNATIEDVEIDGLNTTPQAVGIGWSGFTARRVNCHNIEDCVRAGDNILVEDSYMHDLWYGATSHNDGTQSTGGSHIVIRHNTCLIPNNENACVILKTDQGKIDDVLVDNNNFDGGTYTFYSRIGQATYGTPTNVRMTNNRVGRHYVYGVKDFDGPVTWTGNYWADTGALIP
jgi:hypothetical protein